MRKKLTLTVDEQVYEGLYRVVGRRKISSFIESIVRPYLVHHDLHAGYRMMAEDAEREAEAVEWVEGTSEAVVDERAKSVVDG